jgi:hypothetical protein
MPQRWRVSSGGYAYHVLNRAVGRMRILGKQRDFEALDEVIEPPASRSAIAACLKTRDPLTTAGQRLTIGNEDRQYPRLAARTTASKDRIPATRKRGNEYPNTESTADNGGWGIAVARYLP